MPILFSKNSFIYICRSIKRNNFFKSRIVDRRNRNHEDIIWIRIFNEIEKTMAVKFILSLSLLLAFMVCCIAVPVADPHHHQPPPVVYAAVPYRPTPVVVVPYRAVPVIAAPIRYGYG